MTEKHITRLAVLAAALTLLAAAFAPAATVTSNIHSANHFAWGENIGWTNWYGQGTGPAATPPPVIGPNFMSGFVWCENVGWLNLGDGTPTSGTAYSQGVGDTGVNVDGSGNLTGYAWGENIGWVHFDWTPTNADPTTLRPAVNLTTGAFTGYAWGENIGWINFDGSSTGGATAQVEAVPPTAQQIVDGIVGLTPQPLFSNRNADATVDAADVVHRVQNP